MGWLLVSVVVFLWLLAMGALYLQGRYRYSRRSRAVLWAEAPAAAAAAFALTRALFPGLSGLWRALVVAALSLPLYLVLALLTVEAWRRRLQRHLDQAILRLEAVEARCAEEMEALEARTRAGSRARAGVPAVPGATSGPAAPARAAKPRPDEDQWLKTVEEWERGGGQTRVRSLRVLEWRRELETMSPAQLAEEERALQPLLPGAGDRREQLEARLALVRLALAARRRAGPAAGPEAARVEAPQAEAAPGGEAEAQAQSSVAAAAAAPAPRTAADELHAKGAELQRVRAELSEWRRRREEFLSRRILLE